MTPRIHSDEGNCRRCSECVGNDHHWLFCSFPPFDTDDPEFRQDVQSWWERTGHDEMECPAFWSCKHCSAWTPDDPDDLLKGKTFGRTIGEGLEKFADELERGSKHTPGPWKTYGGPAHPQRHHLAVIDSIPDVDGKVVANCICHLASTNPDADANAKLIAAAPQLLEALKQIESVARGDHHTFPTDRINAIRLMAEAAQKKAIGVDEPA